MKSYLLIAILIAAVFSTVPASCQYSNLEFVENKGQWDKSIKFKGLMNNGAFFLDEKGFRVLLNNPDDIKNLGELIHGASHSGTVTAAAKSKIPGKNADEVTLHSHLYDVQFLNARTPVIEGDKALSTYNNYFIGNDPAKWKGNCRIYQAITYRNIYPGIDVRYYTNEEKLKYDIIVHAGADLSHLAMKYDGVNELQVKNERLNIRLISEDAHSDLLKNQHFSLTH